MANIDSTFESDDWRRADGGDLRDAVDHTADAFKFVDQIEADVGSKRPTMSTLLSPELMIHGLLVISTGCSSLQTPPHY